ncbi:16667_t:CDS:1, partial [Gigaspora margarita]
NFEHIGKTRAKSFTINSGNKCWIASSGTFFKRKIPIAKITLKFVEIMHT